MPNNGRKHDCSTQEILEREGLSDLLNQTPLTRNEALEMLLTLYLSREGLYPPLDENPFVEHMRPGVYTSTLKYYAFARDGLLVRDILARRKEKDPHYIVIDKGIHLEETSSEGGGSDESIPTRCVFGHTKNLFCEKTKKTVANVNEMIETLRSFNPHVAIPKLYVLLEILVSLGIPLRTYLREVGAGWILLPRQQASGGHPLLIVPVKGPMRLASYGTAEGFPSTAPGLVIFTNNAP